MKPASATRSGKSAATENFPVAARFLSPERRQAVMAFYRAARVADDIADDPALAQEEKLHRLDVIGQGDPDNAPLQQLLQAFRWDVSRTRYRDWSEVLLYCRFSAVPVGRFLLDLHGEQLEPRPASDALCTALQVLNHLQDCSEDFLALDRVYLPMSWMEAEGAAVTDLGERRTLPALRRVLDRALDRVDELLIQARPLSRQIADRRLALQAAITFAVAERLARRLRRRDPLAGRVRLSILGYVGAALAGGLRWIVRR
ncbi:MAG: squalene synthase HpnC [Alphaproteobacteria bacterium]|nr:squalene synthase HpnC [Alphaproteobacteria bacterium]